MPGGFAERWILVHINVLETTMKTHQFTLILAGVSELTAEAANALYEAGCDDATLCARNGTMYVHFDRDAQSLDDALRSAIDDVRSAGYQVARVESEEFTTIARFNQQLAGV